MGQIRVASSSRWLGRYRGAPVCVGVLFVLIAMGSASASPAALFTTYSSGLKIGSAPYEIAAGPDGNLWFTDPGRPRAIGRITPGGSITEFTIGLSAGSGPQGIVAGPDGNLWFTVAGYAPAIGRISPAGVITLFANGLNASAGNFPQAIAVGPDGNLWFTDAGRARAIGRITPAGEITGFPSPIDPAFAITAGRDGNLWFTSATRGIGRITPLGAVTKVAGGVAAAGIAAGPDGNVWFTESATIQHGDGKIGRITPAGAITRFSRGLQRGSSPSAITAGRDGNMWFIDGRKIGRVTRAGAITEFSPAPNASQVTPGFGIAAGPGRTLWFTNSGNHKAIGVLRLGTSVLKVLRRPTIIGVPRLGRILVCGRTQVRGATSLSFRWRRNGRAIPEARSGRYLVREADRGRLLSCAVRASRAGSTLTTVSLPLRVRS